MSSLPSSPVNPASPKPVAPIVPKPPMKTWLDDIGYYDDEKQSNFMRVMLYGLMNAGKTTLASTFPNPLFIDTDKGGMTIRGKHIANVPCLDSKGIIKRVFNILEAAKNKTGPFAADGPFASIQTLVLDSGTVFSNSALVDIISQTGRDPMEVKAGYDEYGRLLNVQLTLGKLLKVLSTQYHIVMTALPTIDKDENSGSLLGAPNFVGQYRNLVSADFDEVYFMTTEGTKDTVKHVLYTGKYTYFEAKTRLGGLPYKIENPTFDILAKAL